MEKFIQKIEAQVMKKFDPSGKAIFEHINIGQFTGKILSENVAILKNTDEDKLIFTHPKLIEDYRDGLIRVTVSEKALCCALEVEIASHHPDIMSIWKDVLNMDTND